MKFSLVRAGMKTVQFSSRSSLALSSSQQFQITSRQEIAKKEVRGGRRQQQWTVNCVDEPVSHANLVSRINILKELNSVRPGIEPETSESVARNSWPLDHRGGPIKHTKSFVLFCFVVVPSNACGTICYREMLSIYFSCQSFVSLQVSSESLSWLREPTAWKVLDRNKRKASAILNNLAEWSRLPSSKGPAGNAVQIVVFANVCLAFKFADIFIAKERMVW
jgi:hypothetical protein